MNEQLYAKCNCRHCGNHIEFPIEAADATVACPHCSQQTQLTLIASEPACPSDKPTAVEILSAFGGSVPKTRVSFFYQLGLIFVSIMMVLLPLVYLAMIVAAGWCIYYYATHFSSLLEPGRGYGYGRTSGRIYFVKLLLYFTPLLIGVVLIFFMIKPLFARRAPRAQPLALNPAVESTLYAFVAKICDTVGAPMPKRIDLDCQINAAAGFRRGLWSMFGNDLVLTIGLPLVAGLNLRQFAGVIAHEFGHFTQGFGMRLSYVIRAVNFWFARVVYERDAWDVRLIEWSEEGDDWRVMIVAWLARLGVGFSRLLLMLLMFIGHGVSCFLLRQMEYDADSYEIKLAGSEAFEQTVKRLAVLGEASEKSYKGVAAGWQAKHVLPDNFPSYLMQHEAAIPHAQREKIQDAVGLAKTGIFDTHPSDGDRIRQARRAADPGVFHLEQPATVLFSNFDVVARQVTALHYSDDIGIDFDSGALQAVTPSVPAQARVI